MPRDIPWEDRCCNVPSYSLKISMIMKIASTAEEENRSQSSILKEALEEWFGNRLANRATKEKQE